MSGDLSLTLLDSDPFSVAEQVERMEPGTRFVETDAIGRKHTMMRVFSGVVFDNGGGARPVHYGESAEDGATIEVTHRPLATQVTDAEVERTARAWRPDAFGPSDYTRGGVYRLEQMDQKARDHLDSLDERSREACRSIVREVLEAQAEGARS
jgi:hypothetical protein